MIGERAVNFDFHTGRLDRVVGDNHRLGAYAEREKYERHEGVNDIEHRVSNKREVPLIEDVPRPQKERSGRGR